MKCLQADGGSSCEASNSNDSSAGYKLAGVPLWGLKFCVEQHPERRFGGIRSSPTKPKGAEPRSTRALFCWNRAVVSAEVKLSKSRSSRKRECLERSKILPPSVLLVDVMARSAKQGLEQPGIPNWKPEHIRFCREFSWQF